MAHAQQLSFLNEIIASLPKDKSLKVLDLGSLDINGGIRSFIPPSWTYIGVDLEIGPNVDIACPAQLLDLKSEQFDICISSELFEHNPYWKETFAQMCRLVKEGGIVAFTCAGVGRMEHGTSRSDGGFSSPFTVSRGDEYYANVGRKAAEKAVALKYWFSHYSFFDQTLSKDLYFAGLRRVGSSEEIVNFENLLNKLKSKNPEKKLKIRYWTLKFLPFSVTDYCLRAAYAVRTELSKVFKPILYGIYVKSGLRKLRHTMIERMKN